MFAGIKFSKFTHRFQKKTLPKVKSTDSGKLDFLESIRGIAACAVVFAHIVAAYYPGASVGVSLAPAGNELIARLFYGLPFGFMISGHFAVVLFFTLSGFVLTYKFFQSRNQKDLQKQAAKRYFRLAIPIFCIVIVSYLLVANGAMANTDKVAELTGSPEAGRIFNFEPNLTGAFYDATIGVIVDRNDLYNPVLWTMAIEFLGSFIVFGFASLVGTLKKRWILYIGAVIVLSSSYYVCFILGMILADLVNTTNIVKYVREKVSRFYIYGLLLGIVVLASFPSPTADINGTIYETLLVPGLDPAYVFKLWQYAAAAILLAIVLVRVEIQAILNSRFLVFLGGISFALYLTHYLILHSLGDSLFVWMRESYGLNLSVLVAATATIVVSLMVSVVWKKYIDDMSVKVSRQFAAYLLR